MNAHPITTMKQVVVLWMTWIVVTVVTTQAADYTNYINLFSFDQIHGATPYGDLVEGSNGKLYGVTVEGGETNSAFPNGLGLIFSINKDGTAFSPLHIFSPDNDDGQRPMGALIEDLASEKFYGTTQYGGTSNQGTIFEINPDGTDYQIIKNFTGQPNEGSNPAGGLLHASDGNFYGTALAEATSSGGVLFRFDPNSLTYTVITSLADDVGFIANNPTGNLIEDTNGILYGVGQTGWMPWDVTGEINTHGALYSVQKNGDDIAVDSSVFYSSLATRSVLANPNGPLLDGNDGFIYGTTENGASLQGGCVFRFTPGPYWNFAIISTLDDTLFQPQGGLIKDSDGWIYGTASSQYPFMLQIGATPTYGGVFRLDSSGTNFTDLKVFYSTPDGATPRGRLLLASDGAMYGITSGGGTHGAGTIFALYPTARSWFTSEIQQTNNALSLQGLGTAGTTFQLQAATSPSSSDWTDIATNIASMTGELNFTNVTMTGCSRFFRLVTP